MGIIDKLSKLSEPDAKQFAEICQGIALFLDKSDLLNLRLANAMANKIGVAAINQVTIISVNKPRLHEEWYKTTETSEYGQKPFVYLLSSGCSQDPTLTISDLEFWAFIRVLTLCPHSTPDMHPLSPQLDLEWGLHSTITRFDQLLQSILDVAVLLEHVYIHVQCLRSTSRSYNLHVGRFSLDEFLESVPKDVLITFEFTGSEQAWVCENFLNVCPIASVAVKRLELQSKSSIIQFDSNLLVKDAWFARDPGVGADTITNVAKQIESLQCDIDVETNIFISTSLKSINLNIIDASCFDFDPVWIPHCEKLVVHVAEKTLLHVSAFDLFLPSKALNEFQVFQPAMSGLNFHNFMRQAPNLTTFVCHVDYVLGGSDHYENCFLIWTAIVDSKVKTLSINAETALVVNDIMPSEFDVYAEVGHNDNVMIGNNQFSAVTTCLENVILLVSHPVAQNYLENGIINAAAFVKSLAPQVKISALSRYLFGTKTAQSLPSSLQFSCNLDHGLEYLSDFRYLYTYLADRDDFDPMRV